MFDILVRIEPEGEVKYFTPLKYAKLLSPKIDKPLHPDQIKKMVKKKMKQDHASINLFELILFRNRKVKETVPEKSCFKYNLAALGFALNSFADTINSVEFANSKNALPAEVIFSFQANGIRMPDVVRTKFHPPASEPCSIIVEGYAGLVACHRSTA